MNAGALRQISNSIGLAIISLVITACGASVQEHAHPLQLPNRMVPVTGLEGKAPSEVDYRLADEALVLALMPESKYLEFQQRWVGSRYPACNFFLITALCEAGYCSEKKPFYKAADFDLYFIRSGWKTVSLPELRSLFKSGGRFDAVFQKNGVSADRPGHVMVAVGLDPKTDQFLIAEGSLGTVTHHVESVNDSHLLRWNGGFTIFVNAP